MRVRVCVCMVGCVGVWVCGVCERVGCVRVCQSVSMCLCVCVRAGCMSVCRIVSMCLCVCARVGCVCVWQGVTVCVCVCVSVIFRKNTSAIPRTDCC